MKPLAAILMAGLFAVPAQAKPHWKRIAVKTAVLVGASVLQRKGADHCQRGNPEVCNLGYGGKNDQTFNWLTLGIGIGTLFASEKCENDDGPKPACYSLAYGVPAMQTAFGIHDYLSFQPKPKGEKESGIKLSANDK